MYHLDNTSGVPEMPEPKDQQSVTPRWFGESQEQGGISWPGADWFNTVQAELLNLLAAAGIEPDKKSYDQLSKAIPVLGDAKIRRDLGLEDGFKYNGSCPSIAALREIEPTRPGQPILLEKAGEGCPVINEILYHDPYDTTSPDDGVSVFVTPGGARWKANIGYGYNLFLAGLKKDGSNFSSVANAVVSAIIDKIIANGRVNNVMRMIVMPAVNGINVLKITEAVKWPSIISFVFFGSVTFDASDFTTDDPLYYQNSAFIGRLTAEMFREGTNPPDVPGAKNQATGRGGMTCIGGEINLIGPGVRLDANGNPTVKTYGIVFGNDTPCDMDVRDTWIEKVNVIGFYCSHRWGTYYTFMCQFRDCNFSRNYHAMYVPKDFYNFGEDMRYQHCTFGNTTKHAFLIEGGGEFNLEGGTRIDFVGGNMINFGAYSPGEVKFLSGHIEGIQGRIVAKESPQSYSQSTVYIAKGVHKNVRRTLAGLGYEYYGIYQEYECPSSMYGQALKVTDESYTMGRHGNKPCTPYPTLAGPPSNSGVDLTIPETIDKRTPFPNSYSPACSNRINNVLGFTELSTGEVADNLLSTDYAWAALKTGNASCRYGTMSDPMLDGYMSFVITLTDPSEVVQLFCTNEGRAESGLQKMWGTASVRIADAVGDVMVSVVMASYLRNSINAVQDQTTKLITATSTPIRRTITESAAINMTSQRQGTNITSADFQAMLPQSATSYWQGNDFIHAGLKVTGYVGKIYLALPMFYFVKR